jgi:hypothetical protein
MMDKDTAAEMIQSKALGCLDKTVKKELIEYLNLGGEFPWKEYGEYQNLTSLLPIILELNIPDTKVKDKVAKRIYDAIAEQKARKALEDNISNPIADIVYPETNVLGDEIIPDKFPENELANEVFEEMPPADTIDSIDVEIPLDAHGALTDEPPIIDTGFEIKSPSEEYSDTDLSLPEPETYEEELNPELEEKISLPDDLSDVKIDQPVESTFENAVEELAENLDSETGPEGEKITPPEVDAPIQSKYRKIQEEKLKRKPLDEILPEKEKIKRKTSEEIPLQKEKFIETEKPVKKSITGLVVDIIIYILLLAAIAFVYLKLSSEIDSLKKEVNELRKNIGGIILSIEENIT